MIYFDNNATTQPLPEVTDAAAAAMRDAYANPSSVHQFGQSVRHRLECARENVARLIGASPKETIFTAGGTESINLALRGFLTANHLRRRLVTTTVEHSAVLRASERLAADGFEVDYIGVDRLGRIDEAEWCEKVDDRTALVSIQHANNETGVLTDVSRLASIAVDRGAAVHVDAVQSAGKIPIDVTQWPVQLMSIAAHKFHGPKGVGALYVRRRTRLAPLIVGGTQERELRGGTENVAAIIGMGVASDIALREGSVVRRRVGELRDGFEEGVVASVPTAQVIARESERIHNTSNIAFEGLASEAILLLLSEAGVCASAGAACSSGSLEPSHVLKAMNIDERLAHGAIRFSFSRFNTRDEIESVVKLLPPLLARLSATSSR